MGAARMKTVPLRGVRAKFGAVCSVGLLLSVASCWYSAVDDRTSRGYCVEQERYISHEELKNTVIEIILETLNDSPPSWYNEDNPNIITYSSVEQFKKINPHYNHDPFRPEGTTEDGRPYPVEKHFIEYGGLNDWGFHNSSTMHFGMLKDGIKTDTYFSYSMTFCGVVGGATANRPQFDWRLSGGIPEQRKLRKEYFESLELERNDGAE